MRFAWQSVKSAIRVLLVPTISALLCFTFAAVSPWSELGGSYSFLCYTALLLFFFPGTSLVVQIESTVLGIVGSAIGLGWSNGVLAIAAYCGRNYGAGSERSNAVIGIGLAVLSLVCGYIRSYAPRFTAATRIALFFPIFLLTAETQITEMRPGLFLEQFYVTCFAAGFALLPVAIFSGFSSTRLQLASSMIDSLNIASRLLPISLSTVLGIDSTENESHIPPAQATSQTELVSSLKKAVAALGPQLRGYTVVFSHSRLPPSSLSVAVKALQRIHRNALLGATSHIPGERIQQALKRTYGPLHSHETPMTPMDGWTGTARHHQYRFSDSPRRSRASSPAPATPTNWDVPIDRRGSSSGSGQSRSHSRVRLPPSSADVIQSSRTLLSAIQQAMSTASFELCQLWDWPNQAPPDVEKRISLGDAKEELETALKHLERELGTLLDDLSAITTKKDQSVEGPHVDRDHFRLAFYMTALLDLAKDVIHLLDVVRSMAKSAVPKKRWYLPHVPVISRFSKDPASPRMRPGSLDEEKVDQDLVKQDEEDFASNGMDFATASRFRARHTPTVPRNWRERLIYVWRKFWDDQRIVNRRIRLSAFLQSIKKTPHMYFALKLAAGISLLALPAYLSPTSVGRKYYVKYRGAWAVISYMFVLETHTGAIFKIGLYRCLGTLFGATAAFACAEIAQDNPYALVFLGTALTLPITWLILRTNYAPIGVVAGITLPPVLFISYLGLLNGQTRFEIAWTRFVEINFGIVAAVIIGSMVWPNHARTRYFRTVGLTFDRATEYYLRMSRDLLRPSLVYQGDNKEYENLQSELRTHIATCRLLIDIQRKEVSLLPRPIKLYAEIVDAVDRLVEIFSEIRLIRFSVPRKTAVFDVMPLRRELISAILINLWALNQSFRSRSPLPQFLPAPRAALEGLMAYMDDLSRRVQHEGDVGESNPTLAHRDSLGILYGMAENEALGEVCNLLDELVAAAGTLFGTKSFLAWPRDGTPFQSV